MEPANTTSDVEASSAARSGENVAPNLSNGAFSTLKKLFSPFAMKTSDPSKEVSQSAPLKGSENEKETGLNKEKDGRLLNDPDSDFLSEQLQKGRITEKLVHHVKEPKLHHSHVHESDLDGRTNR